MESADPLYQPTKFWTPGVRRLLDDMDTHGLESFKRWPQTGWFYPRYGRRLNYELIDRAYEAMQPEGRTADRAWVRSRLSGSMEAVHDFDVARVGWNQDRWPFDLESHGESDVGNPPQRFRLTKIDDVFWGRPYLNYLLLLATLSRHVDRPPHSFLEIGGGFGVLGDVLAPRDEDVRYVDVDIPPLLTVAAYYLTNIAGEGIGPTGIRPGEIASGQRFATIPSWRIGDIAEPFDVFVNSFSFQEMEPDVVANYIDILAGLDVEWAVSCNSAVGKRKATESREGGSIEPVTSAFIEAEFCRRGFTVAGRYGRPYVPTPTAQVLVMRRSR